MRALLVTAMLALSIGQAGAVCVTFSPYDPQCSVQDLLGRTPASPRSYTKIPGTARPPICRVHLRLRLEPTAGQLVRGGIRGAAHRQWRASSRRIPLMGGSTIFQTIWNNYNTAAQAALHSTVGSMIPVVAAAMAGILSLMVLIAGKNLMFGELPMGEAVTRGVRALVISALLAAGTFNTYVTTFLTQTLPQQLAQAVGTGSGTASGASSFDTMVDTLTKLGLQAQAQIIGLQYLGYQVSEWLIEAAAKVFSSNGIPDLDARLARSDVLSPGHRARAAGMAVRSHARMG